MPPRREVTLSETEIANIIARSVAQALAVRAATPSSEDTASNAPQPKPCTYKDFQNCKPPSFKGTEGAVGLIRWFEKMETVFRVSKCAEEDKVNFATCSLEDDAHSWWNSYAQSVGAEAAYQLSWGDLKKMLTNKYCSIDKLQKLDEEFWHLKVQGGDIDRYTTRFQQLATLRPGMVSTEPDKIRKYILGLPEPVRGNVMSSKPATIDGAIQLAHDLMSMNDSHETPTPSYNNAKRKAGENPSYQNQPDKRSTPAKAYALGSGSRKEYTGTKPFCSNCNRHHDGPCGTPCDKCKRYGHQTRDCQVRACYECGDSGHFRNGCPKRKKNNRNPDTGTFNLV